VTRDELEAWRCKTCEQVDGAIICATCLAREGLDPCICGHARRAHQSVCFEVVSKGPDGDEFCTCKGFRPLYAQPLEPIDPRMLAHMAGRCVGMLERCAVALERQNEHALKLARALELANSSPRDGRPHLVSHTGGYQVLDDDQPAGFCMHRPVVQPDGTLKCSECGVSVLGGA